MAWTLPKIFNKPTLPQTQINLPTITMPPINPQILDTSIFQTPTDIDISQKANTSDFTNLIPAENIFQDKAKTYYAELMMGIGDIAQKVTLYLDRFGAILPAAISLLDPLTAITSNAAAPLFENMKGVHQQRLFNLKTKYPKLQKSGIFNTLKKSIAGYQIEFIEIIMGINPSFNTKALGDFLSNLSNPKIVKTQLNWFKTMANKKIITRSGKKLAEILQYDFKDLFKIMSGISPEKELAEKQFEWLNNNMPENLNSIKIKQIITILKNMKPDIADEQLAWVQTKLKTNPNFSTETINTVLSSLKSDIINEQLKWTDDKLTENPNFNPNMIKAVVSSLKSGITKEQLNWAEDKLKKNPNFNPNIMEAVLSSLKPDIIKEQIEWAENKLSENPNFNSDMIKAVLSNVDKETMEWKFNIYEKITGFAKNVSPKKMDKFLKKVKPEILNEYEFMIDKLIELYNLTMNNLLAINKNSKMDRDLRNFFATAPELTDDFLDHVFALPEVMIPEIAKKQCECFANYSKVFKFENFQDINDIYAVIDGIVPEDIDKRIEWLNSEIEKGNKRDGDSMYALIRAYNSELIEQQIEWAEQHPNASDQQCCSALIYLKKGMSDEQLAWADKMLKKYPKLHYFFISIPLYSVKPDIITEQLKWTEDLLIKKGNKLDNDKDSDIIFYILPNFQKDIFELQKNWVDEKLAEGKIDSLLLGTALMYMTPELAERQINAANKIFKQNPNILKAALKKYLQNEEGLAKAEEDFKDIVSKSDLIKARKLERKNANKNFLNAAKEEKINYRELDNNGLMEYLDDVFFDNNELLYNTKLCNVYDFLEYGELTSEKRKICIEFIDLLKKYNNDTTICEADAFLKLEKSMLVYKQMEQLYDNFQTQNQTKEIETNIPSEFTNFVLNLNNLNLEGADTIEKERIVRYLIKLHDWFGSEKAQTNKLNDFMEIFDIDDCVEKEIIQYYIENYYINTDFHTTAKGSNNRQENITITARAKQAVYDKYKNQNDYFYLRTFERASSMIVAPTNLTGIKEYNSGQTKEIKIAGHAARIFNNNDDSFIFDNFDENGDH